MAIQHTCQLLLFKMSVLFGKRGRLMVWISLLFIVTLTVSKVTSLHCSDQQLPASGDDDLQQVTTLQYCRADNCTIIRLDTGEELDIVYTTNSLIVTTPTDGRISVLVPKAEYELSCDHGNHLSGVNLALAVMISILKMILSIVIIVIHFVFKELRTLVGKLLILYNLAVIGYCITHLSVTVMEFLVAINSHIICYTINIAGLLSGISIELFATCILYHTTYVMHCSNKLIRITPELSKRCFRNYIIYHLSIMVVVFLIVVGYDVAKGNINSIILPNGFCVYGDQHLNDILLFPIAVAGLNKIAQLILFITYLYYTYQLNKDITNCAMLDRQQSLLHKITFAMGSVVGLSYTFFAASLILKVWVEAYLAIVLILFLAQQSIIVAIFMCSKRMRGKYIECLGKEQDEQ